MKAKGIFKKFAVLTIAGTMVFGSAMVTLADVEEADVAVYAATSDEANAMGYKPGKVYRGDENEFNAKGEALPGYKWDSTQLTPYEPAYDELICTTEEHTHSSETADDCQGYVLSCTKEEHTHSKVGGACYTLNCEYKLHTHSVLECGFNHWRCPYGYAHPQHEADCYKFTCTKTEHTHSDVTGTCYTQKTCDVNEHTHTEDCYKHHDEKLATYEFQMKPDEDTNNGNQMIKISIHVECEGGKAANDVSVTITAYDRNPLAGIRDLTLNGTTNLAGNVEFNISATYDRIDSVQVNGESVNGYEKEIGLTNRNVSLSYSVAHVFEEIKGSAVKSTMDKNGKITVGHANDLECKYCREKKDGEKKTVENITCYLCEDNEYTIPATGSSAPADKFKKIGTSTITVSENEAGEAVISFDSQAIIDRVTAGLEYPENTSVVFQRYQYENDGWHADFQLVKKTPTEPTDPTVPGSGDGGNTGGNQGGSEGGNQGGSESGNQGGSESGNQGGSESGNQGGSESGNQGGSESGNQGGNTNTGDNGNNGENGNNGGNTNTGDNGNNGGNTNTGDNGNNGGNTNAGDNGNNGGNTNTGDNGNNGGNINTGDNGNNGGNTNTGDNGNNGGNTNTGNNGNNGGNTNTGNNGNNGGNTNNDRNNNNGGNTNNRPDNNSNNNNTNSNRNNNNNTANNTARNNAPAANNAGRNNTPAVNNNAANNAPVVVANNDAVAANNADANTDANTDDVITIDDEETPLAANDQDENNADDQDTVMIDDEETPLAAAEDTCYIHWITLILTLLAGGYSLVRAFVRIRKIAEDAEQEF